MTNQKDNKMEKNQAEREIEALQDDFGVEQKSIDLEATFTAEEISTLVHGSYGADKFVERMNGDEK